MKNKLKLWMFDYTHSEKHENINQSNVTELFAVDKLHFPGHNTIDFYYREN